MSLQSFMNTMRPAIEKELQHSVASLDTKPTQHFREMLTYHMGWSVQGNGLDATGKRIRPLLMLLTCAACGADWQPALPAAASLELIHNFSLAHDDIQDSSELRRGQLSVWKKWGTAQAINVGDVLFILAHLAILRIRDIYPTQIVLSVEESIDHACLKLSSGQFLDIFYETQALLTIEDYWQMVTGKTAALISACTQIGSLLGGADEAVQANFRTFGHYLGLAFQVQDDYLGVWGNPALTGKSTESDLVAGKKTLPVIYGLTKNGPFAQRWAEGAIRAEEVVQLSEQLAGEGAKIFTLETSKQLTELALNSLRAANPLGQAGDALFELTDQLVNRHA
jgi:geranylgeranyl diphosphate synthase type I